MSKLNKQIEITQRQSNIELLRLLSMLMVLIVHANSLANKMPCCADVTNTLPTIMRIMVQTFANVNVDIFVLISGFWGIRLRVEGVMNILFQCLFYTIVAVVLCLMFFPETFKLASLTKSLYFGSCWWFVVSYLGLMIVSPVLNTFFEHTNKPALKRFLMVYFSFQMVYGWACLDEAHFIHGYSLISFIGLYLLARYVRYYPSRWFGLCIKGV